MARMEDILDMYHRPQDPAYPLVCMDESCVQLVGEVRDPIPMSPGHPIKVDDEYVRKGTAEIFLAVAPLIAWTAESPMNNIEVFHFVQIRGQ